MYLVQIAWGEMQHWVFNLFFIQYSYYRTVLYVHRMKILSAFRICMLFKAGDTNKVYRKVLVNFGWFSSRPSKINLVISRLFEANVASKVSIYFALIEISYCYCILTLEVTRGHSVIDLILLLNHWFCTLASWPQVAFEVREVLLWAQL